MTRPWQIWSLFLLFVALAMAALGWLTAQVRHVDREARVLTQQAALEEDVRLALWRMDTNAAAMIALENARPHFFYLAAYAMEQPDASMVGVSFSPEQMVASPLATALPEYVRLHFQIDPNGCVTSPQAADLPLTRAEAPSEPLTPPAETKVVDRAAARVLLSAWEAALDQDKLCRDLPPIQPGTQFALRSLAINGGIVAVMPESADELPPADVAPNDRPRGGRSATRNAPEEPQQAQANLGEQFLQQGLQNPRVVQREQTRRGNYEYDNRFANTQQIANNSILAQTYNVNNDPLPSHAVGVGLMQPLWLGEELVLARRVTIGDREFIQGCWLDWAALKKNLLASVEDLAPGGQLSPVPKELGIDRQRLLASLPVQLIPAPVSLDGGGGWSPVEVTLSVAWLGASLAALAVALLLAGVMSLSERRAAFVSAVTHELRTPLTTFRMYAEMLSRGMVSHEERRKEYLETLRVEADRLSHLVENVLSFARLERGVAKARWDALTVSSLVGRCESRLRDRAAQAAMRITLDLPEEVAELTVRADGQAVEQILFNLVDNACKYGANLEQSPNGAGAEQSTDADEGPALEASRGAIRVSAHRVGQQIALAVADDGPGIPQRERRRLFRPFSKTAHEAAVTAPGVGLGLALSRRLARALGGELRMETNPPTGARFVLSLPVVA